MPPKKTAPKAGGKRGKSASVKRKSTEPAAAEAAADAADSSSSSDPAAAGTKAAATPPAKRSRSSPGADAAATADAGAAAATKTATLKKMVSVGVLAPLLARKAAVAHGFTMLSWNVNGLRAVVRNSKHILEDLVKKYQPDVLCLQETKLQDAHVKEMASLLPAYHSYWSCSTVKKGYAGTAVFTKMPVLDAPKETKMPAAGQGGIAAFFGGGKGEQDKATDKGTAAADSAKQALKLTTGIGKSKHDGEGRSLTLEFPGFYLVNLYVPNSGQKLERLAYRTEQWDEDLRAYIKELEAKKPVIVTGDLNVAHLDVDIYNVEKPHVKKSAGCTPQERESFSKTLDAGMVDTFRHQHGEKPGCFTYWSARNVTARDENKGLRLDYFIASSSICASSSAGKLSVHDSFICNADTGTSSDHCPIGLVLDLGSK